MDQDRIIEAAEALAQAWLTGDLLDALPHGSAPQTIAEAHAVQAEMVRRLGEDVAGWKISGATVGEAKRGAVLGSRLYTSGARIPAGSVPLLGVEGEVAFRFDTALAPRAAAYARDEVVAAVTALTAIEVVDSRFTSYGRTDPIHRIADLMSNGALVCGAPIPDWDKRDYAALPLRLRIGRHGTPEVAKGHPDGDPVVPLVAFVNAMRSSAGVPAGVIVTAGSFTGLKFAAPGDEVEADFGPLGQVSLTFIA